MYAAALDTHPGDEMVSHGDIFNGVKWLGGGEADITPIPEGQHYFARKLFSFPGSPEATNLDGPVVNGIFSEVRLNPVGEVHVDDVATPGVAVVAYPHNVIAPCSRPFVEGRVVSHVIGELAGEVDDFASSLPK